MLSPAAHCIVSSSQPTLVDMLGVGVVFAVFSNSVEAESSGNFLTILPAAAGVGQGRGSAFRGILLKCLSLPVGGR